ncbi:DUF551 domain-containing protein [Escherichia coli]|nr:DUF551 domain-containing protein [Escherichia coli]
MNKLYHKRTFSFHWPSNPFDRKGDWRMKWATYIPGHPDANDGWIIPGASWKPSHWMPLPEPPQEVNQ